ncbi:T9SS type B sorting domain-containing protein [Salegentibacter flavus]|uniref:Gliding motility-associated C-terminal domain-containing protein n=1 Tax=Salegentibacter flavus TaxID=287099 RepID=A0A1I4YC33_9FLAO|nr:T9SS type B sorting domain-containing protein [Salegentibacter flavus]SFN35313.1 gliding motility-associated C-terminal domain-containing protein [Salegentibacter flavus]
MKLSLFLLCILTLALSQPLMAQREAANWYFGDRAGLDFNTGVPVPQTGNLQTVEGCATISDRLGNLLFYTDGIQVYDRQHNRMPNGYGLKGNVSSTQSAIIIPKPANPGKYYIFTVDKPDYYQIEDDPIEGVNYTEIDMSLNNGFGDVVPNRKNIHLITYDPNDATENEFKNSEKISAVNHADGSSFWVVTQFVDRFLAFKVSAQGVNTTPVVSTTPNSVPPRLDEYNINVTAIGYLKISPDAKMMASVNSSTALGSPRTGTKKSGKVFLYNFDNLTGKVSDEQILLVDSYPYGVEFSPKSTKLYVTANIYNQEDVLLNSDLYQYDLESSNIANSRKTVASTNNVAGALQLAIDGRIYRAGYPVFEQRHRFMSVIKNPEAAINSVNYAHNSIGIRPGVVKLGLPPFIQSLFLTNFDFKNLCLGDETEFFITSDEPFDSVGWDFGDGNSSTAEAPRHTYASPGSYVVSLTKYIDGEALDPIRKEIFIAEVPAIKDKYELVQCDTGEDTNDGIAIFNLQQAKDPLTYDNPNTQAFFYEDYQTAVNDTLNQQAIDDFYTNQSPGQVVYAKINQFNSECFDIAEVTLKTKPTIDLSPVPAQGCDLGDGTAEFNLERIRQNIIADLNLPAGIEISFHEDEDMAAIGQNPLPDLYISEAGTLYLRADHQNICYGFGSMEMEVNPFPEVEQVTQLNVCPSAFPLEISPDITLASNADFSFYWEDGNIGRNLSITGPGTYSVEIIDNNIGCVRTVSFEVAELSNPSIQEIEIESQGDRSTLRVIYTSDTPTSFSLDDMNGPFQDSPVFRNVPGGPHVIYARNTDNCEIVEKEILVFGFPSFFTPNYDGYNDSWKPYQIQDPEYRIKSIHIFDRYGKLIKELDPDGVGWNGTYNGSDMPSDDYWFKITLENGREFKDHFSLKREQR